MTPNQLAEILTTNETQHHEFKLHYDLSDDGQDEGKGEVDKRVRKVKDEIAKDVIGLANGNGYTDIDRAYLILGAGDGLENGVRPRKNMRGRFKDLQLFQIVND